MDQAGKSGIRDCHCLGLRRAARRVSNLYDQELQSSGLRATQFAILALVNELEEVSVGDVSERLGLDRTTAGKNLKPLEKAGLIGVAPANGDRRIRAVRLTRQGVSVLKEAVPLWRRAQCRFEAANGAKAAQLKAMLKELKTDG
ncbi:MAG: MarR family winged helix-turn-helix transcriptional regulator [Rhizomicrobium sp.]